MRRSSPVVTVGRRAPERATPCGWSRVVIAALVATTLVSGACSNDAEPSTGAPVTTADSGTGGGGDRAAPDVGSIVTVPGPEVAVPDEFDCARLGTVRLDFEGAVSSIAGLTDDAAFAALRRNADFDVADIAAALAAFAPLRDRPTPIGDVGESLDFYGRALSLAVTALAADVPSSTDAFDALQVLLADSATFVAARGPVTFAAGEACAPPAEQ